MCQYAQLWLFQLSRMTAAESYFSQSSNLVGLFCSYITSNEILAVEVFFPSRDSKLIKITILSKANLSSNYGAYESSMYHWSAFLGSWLQLNNKVYAYNFMDLGRLSLWIYSFLKFQTNSWCWLLSWSSSNCFPLILYPLMYRTPAIVCILFHSDRC